MSSARDPLTSVRDDPSSRGQLASWYAQGTSDGFGDRLLMFDNATTGPLELLRIRPDFAFVPDFETAVRARFEQLSAFDHPGFAHARAINHLENGEGLTVVSTHVPGTRVAELFRSARPHGGMHPASARWALGELVSTIAELHRHGSELSHGALAPERIVITPDHHLVVTDYLFAEALATLRIPADRLWSEFGLVTSLRKDVLDQRSDIVQLALIVMSLVLGRRVLPSEYPNQLHTLLDEFSATADRRAPEITPSLLAWLEGALQPGGYRSAVEAEFALVLPVDLSEPRSGQRPRRGPGAPVPAALPAARRVEEDSDASADAPQSAEDAPPSRPLLSWTLAALAVLAVVQGVMIGRFVWTMPRPPQYAVVPAPEPPAIRSTPAAGDDTTATDRSESGGSQVPLVSQPAPVAGAVLAMSQSPQRGPTLGAKPEAPPTGGVRIVSPIPVQVLEGEHILGSSANGPVFTTPGVHAFDLINNLLGYRSKQTVRVVAGRVVSVKIEPPNGSISINAQPWAQVWIDGREVGETPLANLSVPPGEHEIVFRNPQFGERRQKTTVLAGAVSRVSATLNR
jgi:hypothetical protein